jgi:putative flippase GtrA
MNNLLLIGFDRAGVVLWLSVLLSGAALILLAFVLHASITFSTRMTWQSFARYALVQIPNVPISYLLLWALSEGVALPMHFAAPIVTTAMVIWNALGSVWALRKR